MEREVTIQKPHAETTKDLQFNGIASSKIALTSTANSSKLAPMEATNPLMQMRGFFNEKPRNKLA